MKLRQHKLKVLTDVSSPGLEAAVNAFLAGRSEEELVTIQFTQSSAAVITSADASNFVARYTAFIVYTQ